jgi:ABC-type antimicrobial peptide transport system permease subunit
MFVKTNAGSTAEAIRHIEKVYASFEKDYPLEFNFVNELLDEQYRKDRTVANIILVFSVLTIFIACLGLFGLTIYTIEQKVKEIGIRKVLGASVSNIISLLLKEHIGLVVVSTLIAVPIAWMVTTRWIENYAYRIKLDWAVFAVACLAVTLIAAATVTWLARGSARANPVRSLRSE